MYQGRLGLRYSGGSRNPDFVEVKAKDKPGCRHSPAQQTSPGAGKALTADRITTRRRAEKARIAEFQKRFGRLVSIHSELCV
jgi:hypothetical protein